MCTPRMPFQFQNILHFIMCAVSSLIFTKILLLKAFYIYFKFLFIYLYRRNWHLHVSVHILIKLKTCVQYSSLPNLDFLNFDLGHYYIWIYNLKELISVK